MNHITLFNTAFLPHIRRSTELFKNSDIHNQFLLLLYSCHDWPFSWRKIALTATRVQSPLISNTRFQELIDEIPTTEQYIYCRNPTMLHLHYTTEQLSIHDFHRILHEVCSSPVLCSVLSLCTRAEILRPGEADQQRDKIIGKELQAALHEDSIQQLDYRGLSSSRYKSLHVPSHPYLDQGETLERFRRGIDRFIGTIRFQSHIFIPHYNRKKNVSWQSQMLYHEILLRDCSTAFFPSDTTQRDLVRLYHETGHQIQGPMEMRFAWRFNDLKGRCYYATGGTSLWKGLFIKALVKDLINLLPSTATFTRYDPHRVTAHPLESGEVIVTYDYSSFTTSLSELKFFLLYLSLLLQGTTFQALDVYEGIVEYDLGEYILDYNREINVNAEFDYSRLQDLEMLVLLHQCRSGMLGAQGNIGFSTLLHGLAVSGASDDPATISCVGDDALFRQLQQFLDIIFTRINALGTIEFSKFHIWEFTDMYSENALESVQEQRWQYLKRPTHVDSDGQIATGFLPTYPNVAEVLLQDDAYHVHSRMFEKDRLVTLIKQYTRFLNACELAGYEFSSDESFFVLAPLQTIYEKYNIPFTGAPAGFPMNDPSDFILPVCAPPVTIDAISGDWVSSFIRFNTGISMEIPVLVDCSIPAPLYEYVGQEWTGTLHRVQRVLVDLGYMETELVKRVILIGETTEQEIRDLFSTGFRMLHRCRIVKVPPPWYNEIVIDDLL